MQIHIYESYRFLFIKQIHPQAQSTAHITRLSAGMSTPRLAEGETEAGQEQRDLLRVLGLKTRSYIPRLATGIAFLSRLIPARKVILFFYNTEQTLFGPFWWAPVAAVMKCSSFPALQAARAKPHDADEQTKTRVLFSPST